MKVLKRDELVTYLNNYFEASLFEDYGPNGLQIEGSTEISKIAYAVSATRESVEQACDLGVQALIVHHGVFWNFHGVRTLTGPFAKRVLPLIKKEINLIAYHLPLDAHLELGNAAALAHKLQLQELTPFGLTKGRSTGVAGKFKTPLTAAELKQRISSVTAHQVIHADPETNQTISTLGIITGGANSAWVQAHRAGLDAYLTGEISEHDWHEARESGIHYFAAGHNGTEQFGIQALQSHLSQKFGLEGIYLPSANPA